MNTDLGKDRLGKAKDRDWTPKLPRWSKKLPIGQIISRKPVRRNNKPRGAASADMEDETMLGETNERVPIR